MTWRCRLLGHKWTGGTDVRIHIEADRVPDVVYETDVCQREGCDIARPTARIDELADNSSSEERDETGSFVGGGRYR